MHSTEIAAAVRIGMAVGAGRRIEWDEVFGALYTAVPDTCAVQITGWDPVAQRYVVIAERGYPTDRAGTPLIRDQRIIELAVRFGTLTVESVLFLWRQDGRWFRTAMVHVVDRNRSGVTVASRPYDNEHGLSAREVDVATGIVAGLGNQAIADGLVVSRRTVETYVERLLAKLGCASRGEVAGVAARAGLVKPAAGVGDVGDLARLTRGARGRWP